MIVLLNKKQVCKYVDESLWIYAMVDESVSCPHSIPDTCGVHQASLFSRHVICGKVLRKGNAAGSIYFPVTRGGVRGGQAAKKRENGSFT